MSQRKVHRPPAVPRWVAGLISLALALIGVTFLGAATASAASPGLQVYVGYADNLRPDPANFPTPWDGSPNVIYQGCTGSCSFDGGVVRIVNNSTTAQTVDSISVTLGTCTFAYWPSNTVLQVGQQLIIAQTAGGASDGCENTSGLMDTSDIGPNGQEWSGHCGQSGVIPQVNATIDGVASTFVDTAQVLNTGGIDKASCPNGSNESEQWSPVGTAICTGATLALAPSTQTLPVGTTAAETATLDNGCGDPLQGATVDFTIPSGPSTGQTGSATTDADGHAVFRYTSSVTGTDTVQATASNPAGAITSNTTNVLWQQRTSTLTITGGSSTSDYHDPVNVAARLSDSAGPITAQPVVLSLNGAESCTATTDSTGLASCSITPNEAAGTYQLTAAFAGDATDLPSGATTNFTVTHEETSVQYTGPTHAADGAPITLSGVLKEDGATPIAGRTLALTIGSGGSAQSCTGTTNASGSASCTIASVNQSPSGLTVPVTAAFAGDAYYLPSSATATLNFEYMTGRAYGLASSGLVTISPTPDTGRITTVSAQTVAPPCVVRISGLVSAGTLCAGVTTSLNPGTSTAAASVQSVGINVLGIPAISIGAVQSTSTTTCSSSTGDTTIASVTVGGIPVNVNVHPGANTTVSVLGVTLTFNEQIPVTGPDKGLTVNAVHINVLGLLDVIVASSTSDIGNC
ncbi:MAG TPA: choice-of-anchor P family protein [Actinocrinis sp.]|nr:choice-of-anchor P family protein [Actinocrinis sp.]